MLLSSNIEAPELIVDYLQSALPQVQQLYCIAEYTNGGTRICSNSGEYEQPYPDTLGKFLQRSTSGWYARNETPFHFQKSIGQSSLEMELDRDFLYIRGLKSEDVSISLLIQIKPIGISKTGYLMANEKKILEQCIRGFITKILKTVEEDKIILKSIVQSNESNKQAVRTLTQKLTNQNRNFDVALSQFIHLIINKLQDKYRVKISLSGEFMSELRSTTQSYHQIEQNLEAHLNVELNLAKISGSDTILLTSSHLVGLKPTQYTESSVDDNTANLGRFARTYKLLDRYETAANLVHRQGLNIIGKNIGLHCTPPVSNASITDALNKHSKKVYDLFQRFPTRWTLLRNDFRSIANIIEKEAIRRQNIA